MRNYYSYGSLAHDYSNYEFDTAKETEVFSIEIKKNKTKSISFTALCALVSVVFVGCLFSLYSLCLVNAKSVGIVSLQEKLENIKSDNVMLEEEISKKFDLGSTQKIAEKKLGMHRPFAYQIVHIKRPTQNYVVKYVR